METTKATAKFMLTAEQTQSTKLEATQIHWISLLEKAPEAGDLNSKAESVESSDRFGTATIITSSNNSL